jgi:hypothetical protein
MSKVNFLLITAPWVELAVLLRGFCLFDYPGAFHLKNRENETIKNFRSRFRD